MFHGSGSPFGLGNRVYREFSAEGESAYGREEKPDVLIFGHSHLPYNKKKETTLLFNPGSLSGNLMSSSTYGVLSIEGSGIWGEIFELMLT